MKNNNKRLSATFGFCSIVFILQLTNQMSMNSIAAIKPCLDPERTIAKKVKIIMMINAIRQTFADTRSKK